MVLYLEVTTDKYELPVAVADSPSELARIRNVSTNTVNSAISHEKAGVHKSKYKKVVVEDE